ncbi:MAG TPA: signal peptidase I [Thermoanaerobaculia bacterium]|nr:signal peptidase I [Thermoanaerobaculia bacterium]
MNKKKIINEIRIFLLMLLVVTSLRSALADWNDVPTGSMKPTIEIGDRVVVNKLAYDLKIPFTTIRLFKWDDPERGDIVVLFSPIDGTRLVKRVVAIPGDTVAMVENHLYINGKQIEWTELQTTDDPDQGLTFLASEMLGGRQHMVMLTPQVPAVRSFAPISVPPYHYFVLGDNRDNSNDSRFIGFIGRRQIVGEATAVAFSLDRQNNWIPRLDRFFKRLD